MGRGGRGGFGYPSGKLFFDGQCGPGFRRLWGLASSDVCMLLWVTLNATISNATVCCDNATLKCFCYARNTRATDCRTLDWDDYRFFSAVAMNGSVRGAANQLKVNPSTVMRRLDQLESRLGVNLFTRTPQGLHITTEGVEVAQQVDEVARRLRVLESSLQGRDQSLAGSIRVAVPDVIAARFLLQDLAPFLDMYPDIDLEFLPNYVTPDMSRREVDVLISATNAPPEAMVGRQLTGLALAAYASQDYLDTPRPIHRWVDWVSETEVMQHIKKLRETYFPNARVHLSCDQVEMQRAAIAAGAGVGILPCFVGEAESALVRLEAMPVSPGPGLWLLTHPDLRSTRRVQFFLEYVRELFANRQAELEGVID